VSVIPMAPIGVALAASALALALPGRWSRALAGLCAVGALAAVLATRSLWEADVRRAVYIASQARGRWLDRSVDLLLASCALTLGATARPSREGYALALALASGALLCGALGR